MPINPIIERRLLDKKKQMLRFSIWYCWHNWKEQASDFCSKDGIYLLARIRGKARPCTADPLDKRIIYIGQTCKQTFRDRLNQFGRSAFNGRAEHAGGVRYREVFGTHRDSRVLRIAFWAPRQAFPLRLRELYIQYWERKLLFGFAKRRRQPPRLNRN
jgi:hypothetical protein